jgi:thioredoxin reductase (NADPH)
MLNGRMVIYGRANSAAGYEIRDFLTRNCSDYDWVELNTDEEAQRLAGVLGLTDPRLPLCVVSESSRLYCPSLRELATALEWFKGPKYQCYDLAIFGAGPAGLSAALYGASEGLRTVLFEKTAVGGQAGSTSKIENYMGFPDGISGWGTRKQGAPTSDSNGSRDHRRYRGSGRRASGWLAVKLVRQRRADRFDGHDLRHRRRILAAWA